MDPLFKKYPHYSTYAFSGNRLIDAVELEGLEPAYINEKNVEISGSDHLNNFNPDFQESYVPHPPRKISDDLFPINNDKLMLKANVSVGFKGLSVPVSEGEFNLTPQGKSLNKPKFTVIKSDVVDRTKDLVIIGGGTITKSATILIDKPVLDSEGNKLMDFQIMTVSERTESFSIGRISIEARDTYVNGRRTGETKFRAGLKLSKGIKVNAGDKSAELKLEVDVKSDYK